MERKIQKDYGKTFSLRLYKPDQVRLKELRTKFELPWHAIIRQALKSYAERELR